ncbi:SAM-dependent methyltransferase [Patescibacteria group bacterium]|nr:SAM-dependent methyltransferase [Patescibacteria group bacterium]MBU1868650.1 SAM-dependent methyltransferase [Patescibacteria group bacterium]
MLIIFLLITIALLALATTTWLILNLTSDLISSHHGAPFVPLSREVGRKMMELAGVSSQDIVYDLGCGDGRLLITAVKNFGVQKALGYEISPWPYLKAKMSTRKFKHNITILNKDLFKSDLKNATVVVLYLTKNLLEKLKPKLKQELPPGARIITARYPIPGWKVSKKDTSTQHPLFLYQN